MLQVPDCDDSAAQAQAWEAVWRWAECAPSLRSFVFDVRDTQPVPGSLLAGEWDVAAVGPGCHSAVGRTVLQHGIAWQPGQGRGMQLVMHACPAPALGKAAQSWPAELAP